MNVKSLIPAAVVALVVSLLAFAGYSALHPSTSPLQGVIEDLGGMTGHVLEEIQIFKSGHGDGGDFVAITADGKIGAGANQAAWTNKTGRTVYVRPQDVQIGYTAGTATSSLNFYVGTSTATSFTDFARPTPTLLLMDGATDATSTSATGAAVGHMGTSTNNGPVFAVPNGSRVVFNVQEKYACKADGACNTATSTNRGITEFFWFLRATFKP